MKFYFLIYNFKTTFIIHCNSHIIREKWTDQLSNSPYKTAICVLLTNHALLFQGFVVPVRQKKSLFAVSHRPGSKFHKNDGDIFNKNVYDMFFISRFILSYLQREFILWIKRNVLKLIFSCIPFIRAALSCVNFIWIVSISFELCQFHLNSEASGKLSDKHWFGCIHTEHMQPYTSIGKFGEKFGIWFFL